MSHKNLARQALPGNCRLQVRRSQPGCANHGYMAVCQAVGRIPAQFQRNRSNSAQTARNRRIRRNSAQSAHSSAFQRIPAHSAHSSAFGAFQRTERNPAHGQLRPLSPHALEVLVLHPEVSILQNPLDTHGSRNVTRSYKVSKPKTTSPKSVNLTNTLNPKLNPKPTL